MDKLSISDIVLKEFNDLGIYNDYLEGEKEEKHNRFFGLYLFDFFLWGVS